MLHSDAYWLGIAAEMQGMMTRLRCKACQRDWWSTVKYQHALAMTTLCPTCISKLPQLPLLPLKPVTR